MVPIISFTRGLYFDYACGPFFPFCYFMRQQNNPNTTLYQILKVVIHMSCILNKKVMLKIRWRDFQQVPKNTKRAAKIWNPTWHFDDDFTIFGVSNGVELYIVNFLQKKCVCRR